MEMSSRPRRGGALGKLLNSCAQRYLNPTTSANRWGRYLLPGTLKVERLAEQDTVEAKLAQLEAVLFLAREPISTRKLANLAKLADGTEARTLLKKLNKSLDCRSSAFQVVEVARGFQLLTRPQIAEWIRRLHGAPEQMRLSNPAMETLAVVAYRQPINRAEIEAIRGVQCGEILRVLMERDLLRIVGRAEELGRPYLYGTTKKFLQVFGLRRLEELPLIDQIHTVGS
jgi:segregation and condensation protein B